MLVLATITTFLATASLSAAAAIAEPKPSSEPSATTWFIPINHTTRTKVNSTPGPTKVNGGLFDAPSAMLEPLPSSWHVPIIGGKASVHNTPEPTKVNRALFDVPSAILEPIPSSWSIPVVQAAPTHPRHTPTKVDAALLGGATIMAESEPSPVSFEVPVSIIWKNHTRPDAALFDVPGVIADPAPSSSSSWAVPVVQAAPTRPPHTPTKVIAARADGPTTMTMTIATARLRT